MKSKRSFKSKKAGCPARILAGIREKFAAATTTTAGKTGATKRRKHTMTQSLTTLDSRFAVNQQADLDYIGELILEVLIIIDEDDSISRERVRDCILEIHTEIYPNSYITLTPEEARNRAMQSLHEAVGQSHALDSDDPIVKNIRENINLALEFLA